MKVPCNKEKSQQPMNIVARGLYNEFSEFEEKNITENKTSTQSLQSFQDGH